MVFTEREVDLRNDDRQTKELRRVADRIRKIAIRDFQKPIAVIVVAGQEGEPVVKIGEAVEEEVIDERTEIERRADEEAEASRPE